MTAWFRSGSAQLSRLTCHYGPRGLVVVVDIQLREEALPLALGLSRSLKTAVEAVSGNLHEIVDFARV